MPHRPSRVLGLLALLLAPPLSIDAAKDLHRHHGIVRFTGENTLPSEWQTWAGGKPGEHRAVFDVAREGG